MVCTVPACCRDIRFRDHRHEAGRPRLTANAIVATGHNMLGTTLAPATGRLVADIVMEQPTFIDAASYTPDRF